MIRTVLIFLFFVFSFATRASDQPRETLAISTGDGERYVFHVEIARSREQQATGLKFREHIAPDAGMLFLHSRESLQAMWMKNTLIPLDILFIKRDGRIHHIYERAVPGSVTAISSRGRILAVLELRGGTVARLGIQKGDLVEHPALR